MEKYQRRIDEIECQMQNVKSPSFQNIYLPRGDNKTPKSVICNVSKLAELITRKDELTSEVDQFRSTVKRVNKKLERLTPKESDILIKVYVEKIGLEEVISWLYREYVDMARLNTETDDLKHKPTIRAFRRYLDQLIWKCVK